MSIFPLPLSFTAGDIRFFSETPFITWGEDSKASHISNIWRSFFFPMIILDGKPWSRNVALTIKPFLTIWISSPSSPRHGADFALTCLFPFYFREGAGHDARWEETYWCFEKLWSIRYVPIQFKKLGFYESNHLGLFSPHLNHQPLFLAMSFIFTSEADHLRRCSECLAFGTTLLARRLGIANRQRCPERSSSWFDLQPP